MRVHRGLLAGLVVLALAAAPTLAPTLAEARAGDGGSFGSRGSMTYSAPPRTNTSPYGAAPMQRSMTPNYQSSPSPGFGRPAPYYQQRSPFMSGLLGGLIGAGIGGMLFGHGFMGGGLGFFGFIGLLLQIFIIVAIVRFLWRAFTNGRSPLPANGPGIFARNGAPGGSGPSGSGPGLMGGLLGGAARSGAPPIEIGPADYQQFEQLLQGIQAAWTAHDLNALQAMATPEMVSYFNEQLSDQASRGVRNEVTDVRLLQGDLAQAWAEGGREYATVAMRFSMIDVTRDATGRIVDGSPNEHVTATEYWTFVRSRGGHWILSAIQQAR
ncbi:MAG TPA: TIM44-like domain-containing protein [Rhodopila sp.]|nr:TIM44-like domain-containing protein [Rhodopila sp.]